MLMGVHTNMCVLGRPFGLRNLARSGKNVVLVRDLTDTMYNSRKWPYVSHFEGTNRIVEHIEKYVASTITSTDLTGRPAFRFQPDDRPRAVFLIGEDEYKTDQTLAAFASKELEPAGIRSTFVIADPKSPHDFPGAQALDDSDLLVLSVRRRAPKADQMAFIRRYIDSGKPLVGIRTASHAFDARGKAPPGHVEWKSFDADVLGGHYTNHYPEERKAVIERSRSKEPHPILAGIETPFTASGSLYKTSPLASSTVPLLVGRVGSMPPEPVAWVNLKGSSRVFYTSLGHPGDFSRPEFRRLLKNAIFWALDRQPVAKQSGSKAADSKVPGRVKAASMPTSREARRPFDGGRGPLPPRAALASFVVPDDLQLELVLAEPDIRQPVSISFDERGRLWVVQYLQYPDPAGLKMVSHDGVWRPSMTRSLRRRLTTSAARTRSRFTRIPTATASTTGTRPFWTASTSPLQSLGDGAASGCSTRRISCSTRTVTMTTSPTATPRSIFKASGWKTPTQSLTACDGVLTAGSTRPRVRRSPAT